jgi:AraC family transcriptional regulator
MEEVFRIGSLGGPVTLIPRSVPVTMGSPRFRTLDLDDFTVVQAWFPANEVLERHRHERPSVAVMLEGSFTLRLTGQAHHCPPTAVFTEPLSEPHANYMGPRGARVVVVQPDPTRTELLRPFAGLLDSHTHRHDSRVAAMAVRLAGELDVTDDLSALAAEGIVLEMLVSLARLAPARLGRPPAWLLRAQEILHDRFTETLRTAEIAREVQVHPAHLARAFRTHFKVSPGSYLRRLRLDWAREQLAHPATSLAAVALAAGFADQSHFTRAFKRYTGLTPNAYRRTVGH